MIVGIHNTLPGKPDLISDVYRAILRANKIEYRDLDSSQPNFWEDIKEVDYFIYRWAHTDYHHQHANVILPVIQYFYKKKCFPDWETSWHYDDKIKQSIMLKAKGFPVCDFRVFWDLHTAKRWIKSEAVFPFVFKLKSGSGSLQVRLIKSRSEALKLARKMFLHGLSGDSQGIYYKYKTFNHSLLKTVKNILKKYYKRYFPDRIIESWVKQRNYFYIQKFHRGNDYDTRVQVTGARAYAFIRYNRENDFRASGSNNWSLDHVKINMEMIEIAFKVSEEFGFRSMAYDFIYNKEKQPIIIEISYCFGDYPEFSTGYWDRNLVWHEGRFVPQYFELVDLLGKEDLILPDNVKPSSSYIKVATN
jgi:glutathione synthase/RimK-type ligase-like ATP-grasp enzyme